MAWSRGLPQGCYHIQVASEKGLQMELMLSQAQHKKQGQHLCLALPPQKTMTSHPLAAQSLWEEAAASRQCPGSAVVLLQRTAPPSSWCCRLLPAFVNPCRGPWRRNYPSVSTALHSRLSSEGWTRRALPSRRSLSRLC